MRLESEVHRPSFRDRVSHYLGISLVGGLMGEFPYIKESNIIQYIHLRNIKDWFLCGDIDS